MYKSNNEGYVEFCLNQLSVEVGARPAGSLANRKAADFIAGEIKQAGYDVVLQEYPCPDWQAISGELVVAGKKVRLVVNTYSPSCDIEAELLPVSSVEDLCGLDLRGKIAVVHGEMSNAGFMPKNFDRRYFQDVNKDKFKELLEKSGPEAIITVSHYDIPLPVLEDSELIIPSVTVHRDEGAFIVANAGSTATLTITAERKPGTGSNVIGRRGNSTKKILICAHYDTKPGTPGAMDNAAGIAALLLLARYLGEVKTELAIELVAFGGEDSWFPGDAMYIEQYPPHNVVAAINIDGIGFKDSKTVIAFFGCSEELVSQIQNTARGYGEYEEGPFYESNHGFFWPLGIPSLAFTSMCADLLGKITHTENDTIDILDTRKIEQTASVILEIISMF